MPTGAVLGLLMASFSAMQFIFSPIWGRVSDLVGRRPILILGLAGSTASYAVFGIASSLEPSKPLLGFFPLTWLFIARIGAGIAGATISTAQAYIADKTSPQERARGMALIGAAFGIGFTFGPLVGAACVSSDPSAPPSPAAGYVASSLSGVALLWAIFLLPESLRPGSSPSRGGWFLLSNLKAAVQRPSIALILASMFFTTFAFAQFETTLALLTKALGLADKANFYVFAYIGAILTVSQGSFGAAAGPARGRVPDESRGHDSDGGWLDGRGLGCPAAVAAAFVFGDPDLRGRIRRAHALIAVALVAAERRVRAGRHFGSGTGNRRRCTDPRPSHGP